MLRCKAERVGVGGSDEGIDLHDLHVVLREAEVDAEIAERDVVQLHIEALRIGAGIHAGAEAGAVVTMYYKCAWNQLN